jgi:hypothetical protein
MHQVPVKFVPRLLSGDLHKANDGENILKNAITNDEMWVYGYDIETKQHSSHWKSPASPRLNKARQVCLQVQAMMLFLIIEALCIMNLLLKVKQLIKIFIWLF